MSEFLNDFPSFDDESGLTAWDLSQRECAVIDAEQSVLDASDLLPIPRASLRDEFIAEVARIEQRRERARKVPVAIAFLLLVSVCVLWPRTEETQAAAIVRGENPLDRLPLTNTGPAAVVSASQKADTWALVEAYGSIRAKHSAKIRSSFAADESQ